MQYLSFLLAVFLSVTSVFAVDRKPPPVLIGQYMAHHAKVWNDGGVCRHAAAELSKMADRDGFVHRVTQWETELPNEYHITFSVLYNGVWFNIDSIMDEPGRYNGTFFRSTNYDPTELLPQFRASTRRPLTGYKQDIDQETIDCWFDRCELTIASRIDDQLAFTRDLKSFLTKWEARFREFGKRKMD